MRRIAVGIIVTALVPLRPVSVAAQELGISINPYIGYYHFDESSFEDAFDESDIGSEPPLYGVRLGIGGHEGFSLDLAYGRASVDGEFVVGDVVVDEESDIDLFYGALNWHLPLPIDLFLSGGAGAVRYSPGEREADDVTDLLVNYGAGLSVPFGRLRLRADAKDHVDLCEAPDHEDDFLDFGACTDDETLHNIELSAGVEIQL